MFTVIELALDRARAGLDHTDHAPDRRRLPRRRLDRRAHTPNLPRCDGFASQRTRETTRLRSPCSAYRMADHASHRADAMTVALLVQPNSETFAALQSLTAAVNAWPCQSYASC